jgi:trehalose synthase
MLTQVPLPPKSVGDYAAVVGAPLVNALRERAERFRGARVLHISSTAFGGGVAELLHTQIPLMRDLGLEVEWRLLQGHEAFFTVTKAMHNALQGAEVPWTEQMRALYREVNEDNAAVFAGQYDFVIVHDPQPAGLLGAIAARNGGARPGGKWIWRCHIDLTERFAPVWDFVGEMVAGFDAAIFTSKDFVPPGLNVPHLALIPPSIDPLSLKNIPLEPEMVAEVIGRYGVDPLRPLVVQVSRFDPWKDPLGVIDAFRLARKEIPGLQLAMIASMAHDDPEGMHYYALTDEHRASDPDIWLLSNLEDVGALGVNAFQRAANVVLQKSLREGFGLTVTEGMWKRKPVVAGDVGGIRLQIENGVSGYLVESVEACADRIVDLFQNAERASDMGIAARARVKDRFLTTRSLSDYLGLFETLSG